MQNNEDRSYKQNIKLLIIFVSQMYPCVLVCSNRLVIKRKIMKYDETYK